MTVSLILGVVWTLKTCFWSVCGKRPPWRAEEESETRTPIRTAVREQWLSWDHGSSFGV